MKVIMYLIIPQFLKSKIIKTFKCKCLIYLSCFRLNLITEKEIILVSKSNKHWRLFIKQSGLEIFLDIQFSLSGIIFLMLYAHSQDSRLQDKSEMH